MSRRATGFTLLEVMISLAILAVALVAISDLNGGAVAMHAYSRRATEASLLLRGKMLDIEEELQKTGFSDFDDEKQLLSLLGAGQGGNAQGKAAGLAGAASSLAAAFGGGSGALQGLQGGGAAAMLAGPLGGVLTSQATTFIETLKKSVREIRLTVRWQDGKQQRGVSASQITVILPETVGQAEGIPRAVNPQPPQGNLGNVPLPGQTPGRKQ